MKVFSSAQIKDWDAITIREQQITSGALMERAAAACCHWLVTNHYTKRQVRIFCGKGNNGGDGLAIARMLMQSNIPVTVHILETGKAGSDDFQLNLQRLQEINAHIHFIRAGESFPETGKDELLIDALFGTGLNKPLEGFRSELVKHINSLQLPVIAIDIPSGLFPDKSSKGNIVIHATHTLSFQSVKLAFLLPENALSTGEFHILDIGLSSSYEEDEPATIEIIDTSITRAVIKPRNKFSHKGNFGHAALVAGSYGMMGAAVLAAKACMKCGAGKLTCIIPSCGYVIMQATVPEAMCSMQGDTIIEHINGINEYDAVGAGPGMTVHENSMALLNDLFKTSKPLLLDADALNAIAANAGLIKNIPKGSVITPHPKEFEKMFGSSVNDFERLQLAIRQAAELGIYIVLKGHFTAIITPFNKIYFNSTGNAGMAKAGMGDVLTGMITGLMARQYSLPEAAILAVHLHGMAGDIASSKYSQEAMQASDLIDCIPGAWKLLLQ